MNLLFVLVIESFGCDGCDQADYGLVLVSEPSAGRKDDVYVATDKSSADSNIRG